MLTWTREDKIRIHVWAYNILYIFIYKVVLSAPEEILNPLALDATSISDNKISALKFSKNKWWFSNLKTNSPLTIVSYHLLEIYK